MGIKQLYNDNLRKLQNEYGDVSAMWSKYDCKRGLEMGVSGLRSTTFVTMYQTVRLDL